MSSQIQEIQNQQNVYSFLQRSLESQRVHTDALQLMLDRMMIVESNVNEAAAEIRVLHNEIKDKVRLMPSEVDDLFMAVVDRSNELAKRRHAEESEEFSRVVGRFRKCIWSKLKKKFGTSKYIHIRRADFEAALDFVSKFDLEDFI